MTSQVIIFQNPQGSNVCVCYPTGELPIEQVLTKDCPAGAIIVDDSTLPKGTDAQFFDAWTLSGSTVLVDQTKAKAQATSQLNQLAYAEAQHRAAKVGAELTNVMSDTDWANLLTTARAAITAATNTSGLVSALDPIQKAITANAL
jgi:hypothetical protein